MPFITRIEVDGARQIAAAMERGRRALGSQMDEPHGLSAALVADRISAAVPRRTGNLASALFDTSSNAEGEAGVGPIVYAGVIHFGAPNTRGRPANIAPNPYVYEPGEQAEPAIEDIFEVWVRKVVVAPIDALP